MTITSEGLQILTYDHFSLRGPVTLTPIAECLAVELTLPVLRLRSVAAGIRIPNLPLVGRTLLSTGHRRGSVKLYSYALKKKICIMWSNLCKIDCQFPCQCHLEKHLRKILLYYWYLTKIYNSFLIYNNPITFLTYTLQRRHRNTKGNRFLKT